MKALVIGATGIIGNHIVRELLRQGHQVTALSRGKTSSQNLEGLELKTVRGDILDADSLKSAFTGQDWVFQAAAYYPDSAFNTKRHVAKAMQGVRHIIDATLASGIQRLIYTSSLTTIGMAEHGKLADESVPYQLQGRDPHPYFLVKHLSEEALREAHAKQGLPVVMLNPSGCFGPFELKPVNLCLIPQLVNKQVPALLSHPGNVVDTADVARGHVLAAMKGRLGERYILGAHNVNMADVVQEICRVAKVTPPRFTAPLSLGISLAMTSEVIGVLFSRAPRYSVLALRFVQYGQYLSIDKAKNELGYQVSPMAACYERAIEWYKKIGYC